MTPDSSVYPTLDPASDNPSPGPSSRQESSSAQVQARDHDTQAARADN